MKKRDDLVRIDDAVESVIKQKPGLRFGELWPIVATVVKDEDRRDFDRAVDRSLQRLRKANRIHVLRMRWYHGANRMA